MNKTIRPSILPENKKLVAYPLIVCSVISGTGIIINNLIVIILPLIILSAFPGLPILFHLLIHIFFKIELYPDKIVAKDYLGNNIARLPSTQQIAFADISYIYYLGKEINLLKNLTNKLKKFKISPQEINFTKENLMGKYGIPAEKIEKFESNSQNILNDYTATAILMKLDDIYKKYDIPKKTAQDIRKELQSDENFNYEYVRDKLKQYPIISEDLNELKDEFSNVGTNVTRPLLLTKVNLQKYQKCTNRRGGVSATAKVDTALVFANRDGTEKVYLMHFHDLSRENWQSLLQTIKNHNPKITYLMTKKEYHNLLG